MKNRMINTDTNDETKNVTVTAKNNVKIDGQTYEKGKQYTMPEDEARQKIKSAGGDLMAKN